MPEHKIGTREDWQAARDELAKHTVMAPDPFVAPYHSFLLRRTPKAEAEEPRAWRKDEHPD